MVRYCKEFIDNYYYIYVFLALWTYIGLPDFQSYIIVATLLSSVVLLNVCPISCHKVDILVIVFILYQLASYLFSNYRLEVYYYGIKAQVMPIVFYFIGRNRLFRDNKFYEKMKNPMMFAFIVGLILYFWAPDWYISRRTQDLLGSDSSTAYYEATRLSSFWPWSYAMGYGALYFIIYFSKTLFDNVATSFFSRLKNYSCILIAILVLFFAQQRVSIAFFLVYLIIVSIYGNTNKKTLVKLWIIIGFICMVLVVWILRYADADFVEYVLTRSIESDENIVSKRFELFENLFNTSLFGEGLGKYGHAALRYNEPSITDCEYIRFITELGYVGCFIFCYIYIKSLFRAFSYRKSLMFEFCILSFYLAAMIGATPFENYSMQPFLCWFCLGRIQSSPQFNISRSKSRNKWKYENRHHNPQLQ